ncbi:large subunit ribosomal protein L25 [Desulfonatronum thiosulfatophilum]|uniref:Large ribosomal subunit protein bL25 n=1 Tax=Desulfonatronum thiosulfatophilum TaxID=617002 RepID=A0A1G6EDR5_9BACT|nr:50S ribosomal protein L25 [Desulfonatronum thiosulfatophilum]SDB55488.1 large subunit ribosomal protein L25 [Desulfonatronum thiosulfatophilum]
MSSQSTLSVAVRSETGSGPCRRLRDKSVVPGVFYNAQGVNLLFSAERTPLQKLFNKVGLSQVFELEILENGQTQQQPAIIRDIQFHPVKGTISHVDFFGVDLTKKITVYIPVEVTGKAKGIILGGVLQVFRDELEVVGLPMSIPEKIVIDVTSLEINQNVHIQDLKLPESVEFIFDDNFAVVGVTSPSTGEAGSEGGETEKAGE